jgi:hypothetical protein
MLCDLWNTVSRWPGPNTCDSEDWYAPAVMIQRYQTRARAVFKVSLTGSAGQMMTGQDFAFPNPNPNPR